MLGSNWEAAKGRLATPFADMTPDDGVEQLIRHYLDLLRLIYAFLL